MGNMPSHLLAAERAALGGAMCGPEGADRLCELLIAQDFGHAGHQRVFLAIQALTFARRAADVASVVAACPNAPADFAADLVAMTFEAGGTCAHTTHHARLTLAGAQLRRLAALGVWLASEASGSSVTEDAPDALLGALAGRLDEVTSRTPGKQPVRLVAAEPALLPRILSDAPTPTGLSTGFRDLDTALGGLRDGEVVVLAARPSVGKSLLAANIAENVSIREEPRAVLFLTLEMTGSALYRRYLFGRAGANAEAALAGSASGEEKERLRQAHRDLTPAPWFVHYEPGMTAQRAHALARRFKSKHGPCLVVVDYLQLMRGPGASRVEMVTNLSAAMKGVAGDLDTPVMLLSQLNRGGAEERNPDGSARVKLPVLADLRDSGAIEQDADAVVFLARDVMRQDPHPVECIVAKNRPGRTGHTQLWFDTTGPRFRDRARVENWGGQL